MADIADCHDCSRPVLTNYIVDSAGNQWHLRCLGPVELDDLDPSEIKR